MEYGISNVPRDSLVALSDPGARRIHGGEELGSSNYPLQCRVHDLNAALRSGESNAVLKLFNAEELFARMDVLVIGEHLHEAAAGRKFVQANMDYLRLHNVEVFSEASMHGIPASSTNKLTRVDGWFREQGINILGLETSETAKLTYRTCDIQQEIAEAIWKKKGWEAIGPLVQKLRACIDEYKQGMAPREGGAGIRDLTYVEGDIASLSNAFQTLFHDLGLCMERELSHRQSVARPFADIILASGLRMGQKKLVIVGSAHALSFRDQPSVCDFIRQTHPGLRATTIISSDSQEFSFGTFELDGNTSTEAYLHFPVGVLGD